MGRTVLTRVAVFIDWQNAYKSARRAFGLDAMPNERGNFSPFGLARVLAYGNGRATNGKLCLVEIHRGLPDSTKDPNGHGANRRQAAAWQKEAPTGIVVPRLRPLRYPPTWPAAPPGEKGIDVQLALAIVECVLGQGCEVAVMISNDSDLKPVIETVCRLKGPAFIETAAWDAPGAPRLRSPVPGVYHHKMSADLFRRVEQPVNYAHKTT